LSDDAESSANYLYQFFIYFTQETLDLDLSMFSNVYGIPLNRPDSEANTSKLLPSGITY